MTTWVVPANPAHRLEQTSQRGEGMISFPDRPYVQEIRAGHSLIRIHWKRPPMSQAERDAWFAQKWRERDPRVVEFYHAWYACATARRE